MDLRASPIVMSMQNRSGSTWLCNMMNSTGALGHAGEIALKYRDKKTKKWDLREYWPRARDESKVIKVNWPMILGLEEAMVFHGNSPNDYKHIWLRRKNIWQQTVSTVVAGRAIWSKTSPSIDETILDEDTLIRRYNQILRGESNWKEWFSSKEIQPLVIWYEHLCSNPAGYVHMIMKHCGVDYEGSVKVGDGQVVRTRRMIKRAEEMRKKYGEGKFIDC